MIQFEVLKYSPLFCRREYHAITRGFILQEIFRRVEPHGLTIGQFLKQEVFDLLNVDVYLGIDEDKQKQLNIADVEAPSKNDVILTQLKQFDK